MSPAEKLPVLAATVLIVDDDAAVATVLSAQLGQAGARALVARSATEALELLEQRPIDLVVSDLRMPGMNGLELLHRINDEWPEVPVIMLSAHGTVPLAVEAMKAGAVDFMLKPFEREELLFCLEKALGLSRARRSEPPERPAGDGLFLGESPPLQAFRERLRRAAQSSATVLLRGETGTGKELAARAIHEQSARKGGSFIKLSCAALPESLLESELFGHEKGAFTGAVTRKPGRVELAQGGSLFLDEIGDVPLATQVKLLRVLQEKEIERLGGRDTLKVDVRFIA
ncbi:MAG TPA: sigma-54 dependent transcriptional regulator, partial [Polyangiaceae bacterium]